MEIEKSGGRRGSSHLGQKNILIKLISRALKVLTLEYDERKKFEADVWVSKKKVRIF